MYPLKLEAVCKDIIWGGDQLKREYNKKAEGNIAEAWELSVHPEGICKIENGELAGKLLSEYLGSEENFPVMIKLIDARDRLSIQVHPVKTEMWIIMDCEPGAKLVYGLKDKFSEATFRKALENGTAEELLNYVDVHPGDVFFIPQGLVHAIGAGILICEIQQNSNVTYRVYDYGRLQNGKPRELHVDQAMGVIKDFTAEQIEKERYSLGKDEESTLAHCSLFRVDKYAIDGSKDFTVEGEFISVICLDGEGDINGEKMVKGDSYFIDKKCGKFTVNGKAQIVVTRV